MLSSDQKQLGGDFAKKGSAKVDRPRTTIRFQLLAAVNIVLAGFVVLFLIMDYRRDLAERLEDKRVALEEEAKTLLPAVLILQYDERESVQQYIDAVCGRMKETDSPGHHIAVELEHDIFQAAAHHRASSNMLAAMREGASSPTHRSRVGRLEFIVGAYTKKDATVYVSETLEHLYGSVARDAVRRLTGFIMLSVVAAAVVNVALSRIVTRPLNQLVATVQRIGRGHLGLEAHSYNNIEMNYLAEQINCMRKSLADADRNRKMQMAKARGIQQNLLPKGFDIPGLKVASLFQPADDIGGDYYDVLPLCDGSWIVCVADVTGHGIPAAITAAMLKNLLIQAADQFTSPAAILEFINRQLEAVSLSEDFVSMLLVRVLPQAKTLVYASAGHEPGWLLSRSGKISELTSTGMLLGIDEVATWRDVTIHVTERHRLLMVTDGVSETHNQKGEMFGRKRLIGLFGNCKQMTLEQIADRISESLAAYRSNNPPYDDVTVVLVEIDST